MKFIEREREFEAVEKFWPEKNLRLSSSTVFFLDGGAKERRTHEAYPPTTRKGIARLCRLSGTPVLSSNSFVLRKAFKGSCKIL
jgi:hypothetical protein